MDDDLARAKEIAGIKVIDLGEEDASDYSMVLQVVPGMKPYHRSKAGFNQVYVRDHAHPDPERLIPVYKNEDAQMLVKSLKDDDLLKANPLPGEPKAVPLDEFFEVQIRILGEEID